MVDIVIVMVFGWNKFNFAFCSILTQCVFDACMWLVFFFAVNLITFVTVFGKTVSESERVVMSCYFPGYYMLIKGRQDFSHFLGGNQLISKILKQL